MASKARTFADLLASTPVLQALRTDQVRIIISMRVAVLAHGQGFGIKPYLAKQLCNTEATQHFAQAMERMGDCWPEPVTVHQPCCATISYDEMLFLDLVTAVVKGEEEYFHDLLSDMIDERARVLLHRSLSKFAASYFRLGIA